MEAIIDIRIKKVVTSHDVIHVFHVGIVTGTAIMELKLVQELVSVDQDPLVLVLLDLRKLYDNLVRGQLLKTLEGYGAGPKMWDIIVDFWARHEVVPNRMGTMVPSSRKPEEPQKGALY